MNAITKTAALVLLAASSAVHAQQSASIESLNIIEINPAAFPQDTTRASQVRYTKEQGHHAADEHADGSVTWNGSQREAMGGQDAPARIYIAAFDGVFSIDPFVPINSGNEDITSMLFNGTTLETNRALFNRQRIERVRQLLKVLEVQRHNWLRNNGYYGVKQFTKSNADAPEQQADATLPEPSATFRIPAEAPRGKSREQVNASPTNTLNNAESVASALLSSDEPVRISLPFGTAPDVVASVEARNASAQSNEESEELASNE